MSDIGEMYDNLGPEYLRKLEGAVPPARTVFLQRIPEGGHTLDVGCAGGRDSEEFAKRGPVTGIDVVKNFIEKATKRVPGGRFLVADMLDMKFGDETFDAIWANAVLVHLPKEKLLQALRNFARVLKPGGILYIRVKEAHLGSPEEVARANEGRASSFTYFSKEEIEENLKTAGFFIESLERTGSSRPGLTWVEAFAQKPTSM